MKRITLLFGFILSFIISAQGQTIIYVKADAAGGLNNGTSWANAYTSLQTALGAASGGKQIWVAKGTYKPTNTTDRGISFTMKNNVAIYGGFAGTETSVNQRTSYGAGQANETILSGDIGNINDDSDNSNHIINNPFELYLNNSAILDGFTITGGNGDSGGGIYNIWCNPAITNCTFINNKSTGGSPAGGGAIYNYASSPRLTNCTFIGNTAAVYGGAIFNHQGCTSPISNCTFKGNSAFYGGGIANYETSPTITNCVFSGNSAGFKGGGIENYSVSKPLIVNCTFAGNNASYGGGMDNDDMSAPTVKNSIFWGNNSQISGGSNFTYCCIQGGSGTFTGEGNIFVDPLFVDADGADNTYGTSDDDFRLQHESPCVNSGTTGSGVPGEDIIGFNRRSRPDIGAYEHPNIIYVNQNAGSGTNNGTSWTNAYLSFQTAFAEAKSSDTIWVAAGTFKPTTGFDRSISFQLKNNVAIYGGFAGTETYISQRTNFGAGQENETILSGDIGTAGNDNDNSYHVIYLPNGLGLNTSAVLDGFTITEGYSNGGDPHQRGAGIYSNSNNFTLTNCIVKNNTSSWDAGGVYLINSSPVITNCSITGNSGAYGGGLYVSNSAPTVRNCTITNNFTNYGEGNGGGIALFSSNMILENSTIANNTSNWDGGGIYIDNCSPSVKNCLINNNSARHGGGVYLRWSGANPQFYNVTIANNTTTVGDGGSGLFAYDGADAALYNSIFWGNKVSGAENEIYLYGGSVITLNYSCYYNAIGTYEGGSFNASNSTSSNPLFVDAASGNFHLSPGSPCISAGLNPGGNNIPVTDLEGRSRPMGSRTDMGAYECNDNASLPVELTSFTANTVSNGVELKWETATEQNNYGFEIQRIPLCPPLIKGEAASAEGDLGCITWQKIGFVHGSGNSNSPKEYSFIDANPIQSTVQYRLKQIDLDGNYKYYSQIAEVNFSMTDVKENLIPKEFGLSQNYPNPFNPTTTIQYQIPTPLSSGRRGAGGEVVGDERGVSVTLKVYDTLGKEVTTLVNEQKQPGYYQVTFNAANLSTGVYLYRITAGSFTSTKKLMLMK